MALPGGHHRHPFLSVSFLSSSPTIQYSHFRLSHSNRERWRSSVDECRTMAFVHFWKTRDSSSSPIPKSITNHWCCHLMFFYHLSHYIETGRQFDDDEDDRKMMRMIGRWGPSPPRSVVSSSSSVATFLAYPPAWHRGRSGCPPLAGSNLTDMAPHRYELDVGCMLVDVD